MSGWCRNPPLTPLIYALRNKFVLTIKSCVDVGLAGIFHKMCELCNCLTAWVLGLYRILQVGVAFGAGRYAAGN